MLLYSSVCRLPCRLLVYYKQTYTIVTFDLAMAKIAYNILWLSGDRFSSVIIHIGGFHTICAYLVALGHMVTGSGFEEIIIEEGICASGSLHQVLTGKHYNRAIRVHHHMLDAINRLLLQAFLDLSGFSEEDLSEIQLLASSPSDDALLAIMASEACVKFLRPSVSL